MKNDQQKKRDKRRLAGYVRDLAEWIGVQLKRDERVHFTLGSDHVRQIQKFEVAGMTPRVLAESIVRRASSYRTRRRVSASRFYVSARANGLIDQVELDFAEERIRSMPRARPRERAESSGSPETDALGQWLQKCFGEAKVTQITLGCRSAPDLSLSPIASWDAEAFEAYGSTPEWFAPIVMEAATTDAASQRGTTRYVVQLHRDGKDTPYAKHLFRLAGGAVGLDATETDGTWANSNPNVQRFVLDMYERHQQTVLQAHVELLDGLNKLTKMLFAEPRSAT
jgi:hypothetical protein